MQLDTFPAFTRSNAVYMSLGNFINNCQCLPTCCAVANYFNRISGQSSTWVIRTLAGIASVTRITVNGILQFATCIGASNARWVIAPVQDTFVTGCLFIKQAVSYTVGIDVLSTDNKSAVPVAILTACECPAHSMWTLAGSLVNTFPKAFNLFWGKFWNGCKLGIGHLASSKAEASLTLGGYSLPWSLPQYNPFHTGLDGGVRCTT